MKPIVIIVSAFLLVQGIFAQEREAKIIFLDSTSIKGYGEIKKDKIYIANFDYERIGAFTYGDGTTDKNDYDNAIT